MTTKKEQFIKIRINKIPQITNLSVLASIGFVISGFLYTAQGSPLGAIKMISSLFTFGGTLILVSACSEFFDSPKREIFTSVFLAAGLLMYFFAGAVLLFDQFVQLYPYN